MPNYDSFQVPLAMHLLSGWVHHCPSFWKWLGNLETASLGDALADHPIDRPVYVTGLARGGTTILLEFLAAHREVATHRYRDFPGVFVPTWWDRGYQNTDPAPAQERAHGDRLKVTPNSPEAIEECVWMAFFDNLHRPEISNILDETINHREFEEFYRAHVRKMLMVRHGKRYVAKGNYNLTRMQYLLKLFPDARFVVAIRNPRNHIASLIKQHKLFCAAERQYPRALEYMRRVGHYEFGLDLRPINTGDSSVVRSIEQLWESDEYVRGWARYWANLYGWLVHVFCYEHLCDRPHEALGTVLQHCDLPDAQLLESFAGKIAAPTYYEPDFTIEEVQAIEEETAAVVRKFEGLWKRDYGQGTTDATTTVVPIP